MLKTRRGPHSKFSLAEDERLSRLVNKLGSKNWKLIAKKMMNKTPKQCRERWTNYLNPDLKFDDWKDEDDERLLSLFYKIGPKWSVISTSFPARSVNSIRNRFLKLAKKHRIPFPSVTSPQKTEEIYEIKIPERVEPKKVEYSPIVEEPVKPRVEENRRPAIFKEYENDIPLFDLFLDQNHSNDLYESLFFLNQI